MIRIDKQNSETSTWQPLETGRIFVEVKGAASVLVTDAAGTVYVDRRVRPGRAIAFAARGLAGRHAVLVFDDEQRLLEDAAFVLKPRTTVACSRGPYGRLALRMRNHMTQLAEQRSCVIGEKLYNLLVCWLRDHTHVLKAQKYHVADVKTGVEFFLKRQQPNGMIWDDVHRNTSPGRASIFGEALGDGYHAYEENRKWILRRIPVEADVEYLLVEAVWHAWKASGDDAWLAAQMPRLERAVEYMTPHPTRWSRRHRLVKRAYTTDSWDFANPHFCPGDHRVLQSGMEMFLFHGDNSGCYAAMVRLGEMYAALGEADRARRWRRRADSFRQRANRTLWRNPIYPHMVPERRIPRLKQLVGDDDRRMSLSLGYTLNRHLPDHAMAVKVLREYRRRGRRHAETSFAEWWTMDPMYEPDEWPARPPRGFPKGEYMNGAVCTIVAGELARAAFEHGLEDYGADILRRVWALSERDGGELVACYRRAPEKPPQPGAEFTPVDLRAAANVGLKHGAAPGVIAWTHEGPNDLRSLPTGRRAFEGITFDVIDPRANAGRAVVCLSADPATQMPRRAHVPVPALRGRSVYFLHARAYSTPGVVATYDVLYADGTERRIHVEQGRQIGNWWGIHPLGGRERHGDGIARVAWRGANPTFGNVGLYMFGWNNPHPDKAIVGLRLTATMPTRVMLAAVSVSDAAVGFRRGIRSYGIPATWGQAAVYYAVAEGLAGIEDTGRAFSSVRVAPRWAATEASRARVTLHYPACDGYCAYRYRHDAARRRIRLDLTGSFDGAELHCLMPPGEHPRRVRLGRNDLAFRTVAVEQSTYADFVLAGMVGEPIVIEY